MKFFLEKSIISTNIPFLTGRAMVVEKAFRYGRNGGRNKRDICVLGGQKSAGKNRGV
jgi:hypothetical protein